MAIKTWIESAMQCRDGSVLKNMRSFWLHITSPFILDSRPSLSFFIFLQEKGKKLCRCFCLVCSCCCCWLCPETRVKNLLYFSHMYVSPSSVNVPFLVKKLALSILHNITIANMENTFIFFYNKFSAWRLVWLIETVSVSEWSAGVDSFLSSSLFGARRRRRANRTEWKWRRVSSRANYITHFYYYANI